MLSIDFVTSQSYTKIINHEMEEKQMNQKIFFFDIDGTLAMKGKIPNSNITALKKLKEADYLTFICTGRAPFYAQNLFSDLVSGYICCNGRYILYNGNKLHGKAFTKEEIDFYQNKMNELKLGALFVSDEQSFAYHLDENQIQRVQKEYGSDRIDMYKEDQNYYTFDLFYSDQFNEMVEVFRDSLIINDHGGSGDCDCSTIGYDKGNGILHLLKHFNISKDDSFAFGDGYNDQAMFREVGHAIAMGNAVDVLKEKATYITDSIENDGITKALQYFHIL